MGIKLPIQPESPALQRICASLHFLLTKILPSEKCTWASGLQLQADSRLFVLLCIIITRSFSHRQTERLLQTKEPKSKRSGLYNQARSKFSQAKIFRIFISLQPFQLHSIHILVCHLDSAKIPSVQYCSVLLSNTNSLFK